MPSPDLTAFLTGECSLMNELQEPFASKCNGSDVSPIPTGGPIVIYKKPRMTPERRREIAANCEGVSLIASEDNANELRDLERDVAFTGWSRNRRLIEEIRVAIGSDAPTLDEDLVRENFKRFSKA